MAVHSPDLQKEATQQQQEPTLPPKTPHKLNWKGFFLGLIIVILIEWFAVQALRSDGKQILPSLAPSQSPSPTITRLQTQTWTPYVDKTLHFSLLYPADKIQLETTTATQTGALRIQTFLQSEADNVFDGILEPNEIINLNAAIEKGVAFSSMQPGKKDVYKTLKLGTNHFVRIYPVDDPTCNCNEIKYITAIKDTYIVFTMVTKNTISPSPQTPTQNKTNSNDDVQKKLLTNKEDVIRTQFGNIEQILSTFHASP